MLGSQDYFVGQEPTVLDCSVFGLMCMLLYTSGEDNIYVQKIEQEWPNLKTHTERMRDRFYPDWDELLAK